MTISSGKKYYYMNVNNNTINIEEWLDSVGVKTTNKQSNNGSNKSENINNTETANENNVEDKESQENNDENQE